MASLRSQATSARASWASAALASVLRSRVPGREGRYSREKVSVALRPRPSDSIPELGPCPPARTGFSGLQPEIGKNRKNIGFGLPQKKRNK